MRVPRASLANMGTKATVGRRRGCLAELWQVDMALAEKSSPRRSGPACLELRSSGQPLRRGSCVDHHALRD